MPVPFDTTHPKVIQHKPSRRQSYSLPTCYTCGQLGHLQIGCRAVLTSGVVGKRHGVCRRGTAVDSNKHSKSPLNRILGEPNESPILLNGCEVTSFLDTRSNVSTIAEDKFKELFPDTLYQPLDEFSLNTEGAGGQKLPYSGYLEAGISIPGFSDEVSSLTLIVPNTRYDESVPVLLGTNVLNQIMNTVQQKHGVRFLQKARLPGPWYLAFKCLTIHHRELGPAKGRLCFVKTAVSQKVVILVNANFTIQGRTDKQVSLPPCLGAAEHCDKSFLPTGIEVTPNLVHFNRLKQTASVQLSNLSGSSVVVPPGGLICQI